MKRILTVVAVLTVTMFLANSAMGFGLPKMGKNEKSSVAVSLDDVKKGQKDLVTAYTNGVQANHNANGLMLEAIVGKEAAAKSKEAAEGLKEGNCTSDMKKNTKIADGARAKIAEEMAKSKELSAESKKLVGASLVEIGKSVVSHAAAVKLAQANIDGAQAVIKDAPMTKKMGVKKELDPILKIAPSVPGELAAVGKSLKNYIDFAKSQSIPVPPEATDALGEF